MTNDKKAMIEFKSEPKSTAEIHLEEYLVIPDIGGSGELSVGAELSLLIWRTKEERESTNPNA